MFSCVCVIVCMCTVIVMTKPRGWGVGRASDSSACDMLLAGSASRSLILRACACICILHFAPHHSLGNHVCAFVCACAVPVMTKLGGLEWGGRPLLGVISYTHNAQGICF
jgi:hypothetical protein